MITEDYVSFETAKLLKEKGFDCACKVWYSEYTSQFGGEKYTSIEFDDHNRFKENYKFICYAPTLQRAMKWLREVHKIYIEIHLCIDGRCSTFQIASLKDDVVDAWDDAFMPNNISIEDLRFNTYQEAEEAAVKHCLENLI